MLHQFADVKIASPSFIAGPTGHHAAAAGDLRDGGNTCSIVGIATFKSHVAVGGILAGRPGTVPDIVESADDVIVIAHAERKSTVAAGRKIRVQSFPFSLQ